LNLEYEYRGRRYYVYINNAKGGESLRQQHLQEQERIDRILDTPLTPISKPTTEEALKMYYDYIDNKIDFDI
jgi:hypothetical protein